MVQSFDVTSDSLHQRYHLIGGPLVCELHFHQEKCPLLELFLKLSTCCLPSDHERQFRSKQFKWSRGSRQARAPWHTSHVATFSSPHGKPTIHLLITITMPLGWPKIPIPGQEWCDLQVKIKLSIVKLFALTIQVTAWTQLSWVTLNRLTTLEPLHQDQSFPDVVLVELAIVLDFASPKTNFQLTHQRMFSFSLFPSLAKRCLMLTLNFWRSGCINCCKFEAFFTRITAKDAEKASQLH